MPLGPGTSWIVRLELLGLLGFALGYPLSKALANIGLALLLLAFALQVPARWPQLRHDPFCRLGALWLLWLCGLATWAGLAQPETASHQFRAIFEVGSFGFIPLVAWAIRGEGQRVKAVLTLLLIGLVARILADAQWHGALPVLPYSPEVLNIFGVNRNVGGALVATGLLGLLFLPLGWRPSMGHFALLVNALLIALLAWIWVVISSRATWIALVLGLTAGLILIVRTRHRAQAPMPLGRYALGFALVAGLVLWFGGHILATRMAAEPEAWKALLSGHFAALPETSLGIRARLAGVALALWKIHPLTGWGPQINQLFGSYGDYPAAAHFAQLHDGYLEMLARTGVIGLLAFLCALALLLQTLAMSAVRARMGAPLAGFLLGTLAIFVVENASISLIYFQHGWHYLVLFGGLIAGFRQPPPAPHAPAAQSTALWFILKPGARVDYFVSLLPLLRCPAAVYNLRATFGELLRSWFREHLPVACEDAADAAVRLHLGEKLNGHRGNWRRLLYAPQTLAVQLTARLYLHYYYAALRQGRPLAVGVWNGEKFLPRLVVAAASALGIRVLRFENGLLPRTMTVDARGINAHNSVPREASFFRAYAAGKPPWPELLLTPRPSVAGKALHSTADTLPARFLFVPFQVDNDTQILGNSPWVRDMRQLYHALYAALLQQADPDLELVFREHPATKRRYPDLHRHAATHARVYFINDRPLAELLDQATGVVTINSTVGIEALLKSHGVLTLGEAFYNIPGLVLHADSAAALPASLAALPHFTPDPVLRTGFFHYLAEAYAVPGAWRQADTQQRTAMATRIGALLAEDRP